MATTIDNATKVNVGIFVMLLGATAGGAWWASDIMARVGNVETASDRQVAILERIDLKIGEWSRMANDNSKAIAVIGTQLQSIERRIGELEKARVR